MGSLDAKRAERRTQTHNPETQTPALMYSLPRHLPRGQSNLVEHSRPQLSPRVPQLSSDHIEEMRSLFNIFDVHKTGKLNSTDIMRAMRELGEELDHEEVEDMLKIGDADGDGFINFEDFLLMVLH